MESLLTCCLFCCVNPIADCSASIAMDILKKLEETLQEEFFPISNQERRDTFLSKIKYFRPNLLDLDEPKTGFVKDTIFKQQLIAGISSGLKESNVSVWSITRQEERAISIQLINSIFINMLAGETKFNYVQNIISTSIFDKKGLPDYKQLHPKEVENFLETIRSLPNGSKIDLKTQDPVEHKALNIQIEKAISAALEKLDVVVIASTSINTFRSEMLEKEKSDEQQLTAMFENNSVDMSRI